VPSFRRALSPPRPPPAGVRAATQPVGVHVLARAGRRVSVPLPLLAVLPPPAVSARDPPEEEERELALLLGSNTSRLMSEKSD